MGKCIIGYVTQILLLYHHKKYIVPFYFLFGHSKQCLLNLTLKTSAEWLHRSWRIWKASYQPKSRLWVQVFSYFFSLFQSSTYIDFCCLFKLRDYKTFTLTWWIRLLQNAGSNLEAYAYETMDASLSWKVEISEKTARKI